MKLAYIIIAHQQFHQFKLLVDRLNGPGISFIFHISQNGQEGFYEQVHDEYGNVPNVRFAKRRNIYWGDFNIVRAAINCIETLVESGFEYDYAISLSGQDYPLASHETICQTLSDGDGKQFMEHYNSTTMEEDDYRRYLATHVWIKNHHYWYPHTDRNSWKIKLYNAILGLFLPERRTLPNGYHGYKGSFWWQLTKECIDYTYSFLKSSEGKRLIRYFSFTYHPGEFFFHTMLLNSPFKGKIINEDNHFAVWYQETGHPKTFTDEDFDVIMSSGKLFGRKFDLVNNETLFERIDAAADAK